MQRPILAAILLAVFAVAACGASAGEPSPSSDPTPVPTPAPTQPADPGVSPVAPTPEPTPGPTPQPTTEPTPSPIAFDEAERRLVDGIVRGAIDCLPVREGLPGAAIAGIECASDDPDVARIGFYRFASEAEMLDVYYARMEAEGIAVESGACADGEGEGAYYPGEDEIAWRQGCFINDEGYANYRATLHDLVYVGILGRTDDMRALEALAWKGSMDTPGSPTIWMEPGA